MSEITRFLKQNKPKRETVKYIASKAFIDENGKPIEWTLKPVNSRKNDEISNECMGDVNAKAGSAKFNVGKYNSMFIAASVVEPNLYNAELQDSYGVKTPHELLLEMVDDIGEYNSLLAKVQEISGTKTFTQLIEEAKN